MNETADANYVIAQDAAYAVYAAALAAYDKTCTDAYAVFLVAETAYIEAESVANAVYDAAIDT